MVGYNYKERIRENDASEKLENKKEKIYKKPFNIYIWVFMCCEIKFNYERAMKACKSARKAFLCFF